MHSGSGSECPASVSEYAFGSPEGSLWFFLLSKGESLTFLQRVADLIFCYGRCMVTGKVGESLTLGVSGAIESNNDGVRVGIGSAASVWGVGSLVTSASTPSVVAEHSQALFYGAHRM